MLTVRSRSTVTEALPDDVDTGSPSLSAPSDAIPAVVPIPLALPLIPEPDVDGDGGGAAGRAYVIGGNVLGVVLGIVTVVALVWGLVIALRADNTPEAMAARSMSNRSSSGGDGSGALGTGTQVAGTSTDVTVDASGTADTSGAATSAAGAAGDAGTGAGGDSGGVAPGGAFKFAPATGTYAVTGTGFRKSTPPGTAVPVSNTSLEVAGAGAGCYNFTFTVDPGNWNQVTLCGTNDGGIVMPKSSQYIKTVLVGTVTEESTETLTCSPPDIMLPSNPAPGTRAAAGACIGSNSSTEVPGKHKETTANTVVGKETVAGVEAWHVRRNATMEPADSQNTQRGQVVEDYWFSTSNGLLMRWKQDVNVTTTVAAVLNVAFVQQSDLSVTSPNPS